MRPVSRLDLRLDVFGDVLEEKVSLFSVHGEKNGGLPAAGVFRYGVHGAYELPSITIVVLEMGATFAEHEPFTTKVIGAGVEVIVNFLFDEQQTPVVVVLVLCSSGSWSR